LLPDCLVFAIPGQGEHSEPDAEYIMTDIRVKICGITNLEDALHAVRSGADALGFVFYRRSPRCVMPEQVRAIIAGLPPLVTTVGLFVNQAAGEVRKIVDFCGLDVIQLHGEEDPRICRNLSPSRVVKAVRLRDSGSLEDLHQYPVSAVLLDAWVPDSYGGTGHRCDWQLAARVAKERTTILAGGLDAACVAEAVRQVRPYAVDVSSGVERSPGVKDPDKVAAFIYNAKIAAAEVGNQYP
jgi:phosphoribosylanthranilate isomerase